MLEAAVAAGIAAAGGEAMLGGILPTPGAPLLVRRHGFALAVVLSASHNPYEDNGIKFFGGDGYKLSDATELEIERLLDAPPEPAPPGPRAPLPHGAGRLRGGARGALRHARPVRQRLLLDCANGATYEVAPALFRRLGADVEVLAAEPDGRNINDGCGSTHIDALAETVREGGHDAGFAFDGDGDRVLAVDRNGVGRRRRRADRARRGPPRRPGRRRDGDDQLRLPHRHARGRASRWPPRRSATATCSRSCAGAAGRSAASSPGTSSSAASCPPATGSPPRC